MLKQDSWATQRDRLAARLLRLAAGPTEGPPTEREGLQRLLAAIAAAVAAEAAVLAHQRGGGWETVGAAGRDGAALPLDLIADAADRDQPLGHGPWLAAPLPGGKLPRMLVLHGAPDSLQAHAGELAEICGEACDALARRQQQNRRIERLAAILEIAGQWNRAAGMEPLLTQMAETSCRLLGAERATIFLWDKKHKQLVGRPALGIEGGELRLPDDTGVVGEVVHTGEIRRVDEDFGTDAIARQVDEETGFRTRNLVCVPLWGRKREVVGAFELMNKRGGNFTPEDEAGLAELADHASAALENAGERDHLTAAKQTMVAEAAGKVRMIGESPAVAALTKTIHRVAGAELAVLILGENGTGKEVVSQMIHYLSPRRDEPFVAVNCAALTETLLESELFGHEQGAFTDARETRQGKFELASGGTLFLDEIGDMSLGGQAKLLRVLEEHVVVRVGGSATIPIDTRVIAATNQDLAGRVSEGKFRQDLYFRLNVVTLNLPPLRERGDDILLLARHFLDQFCTRAGRPTPTLSEPARRRLLSHPWPGNVRELRNLMERIAYLQEGGEVDEADLAFVLSPGAREEGGVPLGQSLTDATHLFQEDYIRRNIDGSGGNMTEAARRLGLHRSNLYRKMRQLGMPTSEEE